MLRFIIPAACMVLAACVPAETGSTPNKPSSSIGSDVFVGDVAKAENKNGRYLVELTNVQSIDRLFASIDKDMLGATSNFDPQFLKPGSRLKVSGSVASANGKTTVIPNRVLWHRDVDIVYNVDPVSPVNEGRLPQSDRAKCEAAGGVVQRGGIRGSEICVQKYADAGETCSDSSQCLGTCRTDDRIDPNLPSQKAKGYCAHDNNQFGCYAIVENGITFGAICVD